MTKATTSAISGENGASVAPSRPKKAQIDSPAARPKETTPTGLTL